MTSPVQRSEPAITATTPCGEAMTDHSQAGSNKRIKVADLELSRTVTGFTGLQGYAKMWIFLRWHGRPFAKIIVPVRGSELMMTPLNYET